MRRGVLLGLLVLGGCGFEHRDPAALARFDGDYAGQFVPAGGAPGCSSDPKPLRMHVADGRVTVDGHGRSRTLAGLVETDGAVSAQNNKGDRVLTGALTGALAGGRFVGSMTTVPTNAFDGGLGEQGRSCIVEATATRIVPGG